jgi:galactose-6-phosphate isomerase
MPNLDVSDVLLDPDFATTISIVTTTGSVTVGGISQDTTEQIDGITAVVTQGSGQQLILLDDGSRISDSITVHCLTPLRAATADTKADIVIWNSNSYLVKMSYDWSTFGRGFWMANCEYVGKANP